MHRLKPFISISAFICGLLLIVFIQMEERRLGYDLLGLRAEQRKLVEDKKFQEIAFAKASKLEILHEIAKTRLSLRKTHEAQVIHLTTEEEER